jgi:ubiquinone/menaquinone biosynthesis C-methylase UbiE
MVYDGLLHFYPYQHLQELVYDEVNPTKNMRILDLGSGSGNQTIKLAKIGCSIDAVDNSQSMLKRLDKKKKLNNYDNIQIFHADLISFLERTTANSYDRIVLTNVLYTVQDREVFWKEIMKTLKNDGKIVATNSDRSGSGSLIREHILHKNRRSLLRPKLVAVFVIDMLISEMSKSGQYSFIDQKTIEKEVSDVGAKFTYIKRCYGGDEEGVNILFDITKI